MRIVLIGQAAFGAKVLEGLLGKGENVVAVYTLPDGPKGKPDPTKAAAQDKGIPVIQPQTYKDDQTYQQYEALKPDLTVMAFVTPIIPERFFSLPAHGTINYHPSLLPRHRGASAINWAVIMGDKKTGLSVFWPDGGIDTGPILLQKELPIGLEDTTGSLYFNHLFPMGVDAMLEAVELVKAGNAPKLPQDESLATYEPICNDRVAAIDWSQPGQTVYDLIRGCDPQPGAFAMFNDEKIRFYGSIYSEEALSEKPGTVLGCGAAGIRIAVRGGAITVAKVRTAQAGKVAAGDFVDQVDLKPGDHFS